MSRRRGEFEHRTSIFEGAFRAWSHLGGLEAEDLESKSATDLDPLTNPLENDPRLKGSRKDAGGDVPRNPDGSKRREYPYEPLPRSGLAHPYVQAILSPWLGPDADNEAIQLGLTTLRTWWQHRRKGESGSAIAALATEKMKGVVEGYTRHFFTLAHCLIMNDKEQPPRSLHTRIKELDKQRNKRQKKRVREDEDSKLTAMALSGGFGPGGSRPADHTQFTAAVNADLTDTNLSPLERLHAAQRRQLAESGGIHSNLPGVSNSGGGNDASALSPVINMEGKCIPGKLDLPGIVDTISQHASQTAHRGVSGTTNGVSAFPTRVPSSTPFVSLSNLTAGSNNNNNDISQYGDPTTTPVVFVSDRGDIQIAMTVEGITCAHCVKIVETVLKGCNGNKSPIDGLLDAAADRVLCSVLIKIDRSSNAKRVASEAARNLAMVGYTAKAKEMSIIGQGADRKATMDLGALSTAFEVVASTDSKDVFNWNIHCTCPDNGILRDDCARHSQMNTRIFEAFDARAKQVAEYMAGCGQKYGMPCTCGPGCRCANCSEHCKQGRDPPEQISEQQGRHMQQEMPDFPQNSFNNNQMQHLGAGGGAPPPHISAPNVGYGEQGTMNGFPGNGININVSANGEQLSPLGNEEDLGMLPTRVEMPMQAHGEQGRRSSRNPSIISFGGVRGMSVSSEATFGRAMSGLSALSIDWENLEDFDVNVDHSAHINNSNIGAGTVGSPVGGSRKDPEGGIGEGNNKRRTSGKKSFAMDPNDDSHVSFKVA